MMNFAQLSLSMKTACARVSAVHVCVCVRGVRACVRGVRGVLAWCGVAWERVRSEVVAVHGHSIGN